MCVCVCVCVRARARVCVCVCVCSLPDGHLTGYIHPERSLLYKQLRQYLYFCTSKASKVSTWLQQGERHGGERLAHNVVVHVREGVKLTELREV